MTCAIVCPNYYDMHLILRERLEAALGDELYVEIVITRTDVDWDELSTRSRAHHDRGPRRSRTTSSSSSRSSPRATSRTIRRAISAGAPAAPARCTSRTTCSMYFDESLFLRNFHADDEIAMIRALGDAHGRGAASSTSATSTARSSASGCRRRLSRTRIAVPHAMAMSGQPDVHRDRRQRDPDGLGREPGERDRADRVQRERPQRPSRRSSTSSSRCSPTATRCCSSSGASDGLPGVHRGARAHHREVTGSRSVAEGWTSKGRAFGAISRAR